MPFWLAPILMSLIGTAVSAGTSISTNNKNLAAQKEASEQQLKNEQIAAQSQSVQNANTNYNNMQQTLSNMKTNIGMGTSTSSLTTNNIAGIQGLDNPNSYLNEDKTNYFKFGGHTKLDRESLYISPNNLNAKDNTNDVRNYRDRLAKYKFGGRKC